MGKLIFSRAQEYRQHFLRGEMKVKETFTEFPEEAFTERHIQCIWYDSKWRPNRLKTSEGWSVRVIHPGEWNLEAGPDFLHAVIEVEGEKYTGDVEIHRGPKNWIQHGHETDRRYRNVKFHVTYHPGTLDAERLPKGAFQISLSSALKRNPCFSFGQIDLSAYPYEIEEKLTPLRKRLASMSVDEKINFLNAAGEERLRKKTKQIRQSILLRGKDQVLYEEIMIALGYKHNKNAFKRMAQALPLKEFRKTSCGDPVNAYALLLGISGLMPDDPNDTPDPETACLIRSSWDFWWKNKESFQQRILPQDLWNLAYVRPLNHPRRRMMAAAYLFTEDEQLSQKLLSEKMLSPKRWRKKCLKLLEVNTQTYWTRRLSFSEKKETRPYALIGKPRAVNILNNVFVPFLAASVDDHELLENITECLLQEPSNQIIRQTAFALFGPDHPPKWYNTGLRRQGLIQVFKDFGLQP